MRRLRFAAIARLNPVGPAVASNARSERRLRWAAAPVSATVVASVQSAPISALVQRLLTESDNDLAEALGRAVAIHDGAAADFAGEAAAVSARVRPLVGPAHWSSTSTGA